MTTITPALRALLHELVDTGRVPGLALAVQPDDGPIEHVAVGSDAAGQPLTEQSLFIVASITKMATALAVLRLVDRGLLALDDQLSDHLPSALAAQDGVTIRSLLCHTSGLPIDIPPELAPYAPGLTWAALAEAALLTPPEAAPWARVQYSNVGYGLLALVAQERAGLPFADLLAQQVLAPLGIEGYLGVEPPRPVARLADVRGDRARDAELQPFNSPFYRSLALPWAGLVTSPAGALAIVRAFAGFPQGFLGEPLRREAVADQTRGLGGGFQPPLIWHPCPWGLGPELRGAKEPHWTPSAASPASFGHSGASGCVAWHDPERRISWALIGTRTAENGWLLRRGSAVATLLLGQG
ncbi:beta-lactamase family protein [Chloroflexia bacterium SDU3-3]|nr:beta-lactamase family protein [Chloroflexia bacterium SDU3-3]